MQNSGKSIQSDLTETIETNHEGVPLQMANVQKMEKGKKFLLPLKKQADVYILPYESYTAIGDFYETEEIIGTNYKDAKLVINENIDDEAIQIFINSGGTTTDFSYHYPAEGKPFLVSGEEIKVNDSLDEKKQLSLISYLVIIGGVIIFLSIGFFINKKK